MQNLKKITKEEAISKFGKHFLIVHSKNDYGYVIKEYLGLGGEDIFRTDKFYNTVDKASVALVNLIKDESQKTLQFYANMSKSLRSKWILFSHKKGWIKGVRAETISENLLRLEKAKKNIKVQKNDLTVEMLPDIMYIPETYIEREKEYYQFIDSNTMQHENKLITLKVNSISFEIDSNSVINMTSNFVTNGSNQSRQSLVHSDLMNFNGEYSTFHYSNSYLFFDKKKCSQFVQVKIEEEIESLNQILKKLN